MEEIDKMPVVKRSMTTASQSMSIQSEKEEEKPFSKKGEKRKTESEHNDNPGKDKRGIIELKNIKNTNITQINSLKKELTSLKTTVPPTTIYMDDGFQKKNPQWQPHMDKINKITVQITSLRNQNDDLKKQINETIGGRKTKKYKQKRKQTKKKPNKRKTVKRIKPNKRRTNKKR